MDKDDSAHFFEALERRLAGLEPRNVMRLGRDRWLVGSALVGFLLTFASKYVEGWTALLALIVGAALEFCALGILLWRQIKDVTPEFIDAKRKFAVGLDVDFVENETIRTWVSTLSEGERANRLRFVQDRIAVAERRFSLLFGAVDKLGILPMMVAVFLQVRALSTISLWVGVLGAVILAFYLLALWVQRFRIRLELYERLLGSS